jgi:hypothetical protein
MINVSDPRKPKGIVWLASYPKSGNTWLRMFLYQLLRIQNGMPREEEELNKLDKASGYEARLFSLFEQFLEKPLATASFDEVMSVRPLVQSQVAERMPQIALLKTHNLLGNFGKVPLINLKASVGSVYIVRDPRDIAPSLAKHLGCSLDDAIKVMATAGYRSLQNTETAVEVWGSWSQHVASWTMHPDRAALVLRYEDMLANPTAAFTAVMTHLRQSPPPKAIAEAIELSSFAALKEQEKRYNFRERSPRADAFFTEGKAGIWRSKLSGAQAKAIEVTHRDQMKKFGYLG